MVNLDAIHRFYSNYIKFTTNKSSFFFILLIIEFVPIYIGVIESSNLTNSKIEDFLEYNFYLNYLTPSYFLKAQITCENILQGNLVYSRCEVTTYFYVLFILISYSLAFTTFFLLCLYPSKNKKNSNKIRFYVNYLFVNMYEAYSHFFVFGVFFIMINKCLNSYDSIDSDKPMNLYFFLLALFNLSLYALLNYFYLHTNLLIMNLGRKLKSYKENNFSPMYNYIILIIKILVCFRNNIVSFKMGSYNSAFSFLILLIFITFVVYILSKIIYGTPLYMINSEFVTLRLILIFFVFYQLIFKFIFGIEQYFTLVTPFNLIFGICTGFFLNNLNEQNLLNSGMSVIQLSWILNEYLKIKDSKNETDKFKFYDYIKSIKFNSYLKFKESTIFDIEPDLLTCPDELFLMEYIEIIKSNQNVKLQFNDMCSKKLFRLCYLIIYKFDAINNNKFLFLVKKELNNNKSSRIDIFKININYFYSSFDFQEQFEKNTKIYKMIKLYCNCNMKVLTILKNLEDTAIKFKISLNDKFFNIIFKLSHLKSQLLQVLLYLFNNRKIYFDQYNFFILNYFYEIIYKERIEEVDIFFEDKDKQDIIKHNYFSDKYLNIEYSIKDDIFTIINSSKDMCIYKGMNFEVLFPQKLRKFYLKEFRNQIQKINKNKIEFIHYVSNSDVKRIKFKFSTFQNNKDNSVYIIGEYSILQENIIVTRNSEHFFNNERAEVIERLSISSCEVIGLSLNFLENLKDKNEKIYLNSIFIQSSIGDDDHKKFIINKNTNFSDTTLNQEYRTQIFSEDEFYVKKLTSIKVDGFLFNIYDIKPIRENLSLSRSRDISIKRRKTKELFEEIDIIETQSITSNRSQKSYENKITAKKKKIKNEKNKTSILLIIFNIFLIIYSLIFLYFGVSLDQDLKKFYSFRNSFHDLRYFFYHTYMNLFQNIFIYKENTQDISNYFEVDFFAKFSSNPEVKVDIALYCIEEFNLKLDLLKEKITNFQKQIYNNYKIGNLDIQKSFEAEIQMVLLSRDYKNTAFDIEKVNTKIFEAVGLYLNLAYKSFEQNNPFTNLYIISQYKGNYDFSNIIYSDLKDCEISVYNIFMNYNTFYDKFEDLAYELDSEIHNFLHSIWVTVVILSIILVSLHFIYLLLSLLIIKKYDASLSEYCVVISQLLNDTNIKILNRKVLMLKTLINPVNKTPMKILDELKHINNDQSVNKKVFFSKDKKNIRKNNNLDSSNERDEHFLGGLDVKTIIINNNKFYTSKYEMDKVKNSKENMLRPFIKFIICLFFIYFVAFFIMLFFWNDIHEHMINLNNYSNEFMNNNNVIINNVLLFQSLIANNQTDLQLNVLFNNDGSKGYVRRNIEKTYERFKLLKKYETNEELQPMVNFKNQVMDCKSGYKVDDLIYSRFKDKIDKLIPSLEQVCKTYDFMNGGSFDKIQSELLYNNLVLLNTYEQSGQDYTKMKAIWDDFNFYDVFIIFLLIIRPINDYIGNNFIFPLVINIIDNYLFFSLIYLILNILADIVIFMLIKFFIINKIENHTNEIKEFILWL